MLCWSSEGGSTLPWSGLSSGALWCYKCGSLVLTGLPLSELVNTKWQHTELQLLNLCKECSGCCSALVSGVVGSKDIFLPVEMWYIHGALLTEVGILKLHFCLYNLHLLVWILFQKYHLMWSQSNWKVFLLAGFAVAVLSCHWRKLCKLIQWHCWGSAVQNWRAVTAAFHFEYSLANGQ